MIVPLTIHRKKKRLGRLELRSLITSRQSDSFGRISPFLCFYIVYQVSSHVFTVTKNTTYRKFYQCNSLFFISLPIKLCALTLPLSVTRALKTIEDDSGKRCNLKKQQKSLLSLPLLWCGKPFRWFRFPPEPFVWTSRGVTPSYKMLMRAKSAGFLLFSLMKDARGKPGINSHAHM